MKWSLLVAMAVFAMTIRSFPEMPSKFPFTVVN